MTHKRKGQLTVSGEWAQHLRPLLRRAFWKGDRQAGKSLIRKEQSTDVPPTAVHDNLQSDIDKKK